MRSSTSARSMRVATVLAVLAGSAGLASLTALTSTAQADPSFVSAYAGVGSDVTQDVYAAMTGLSPSPGNGATTGNSSTFDATTSYQPLMSSNATGNLTIDSFDANPSGGVTTNPGCITTKLGGPSFDRPSSSTAGITALYDEVTGTAWDNTTVTSCTGSPVTITGQIDFARSARGPKTTGSTLTFVPFARDALGIATYDHDTGHLASAPITTGELTALYSSSTGTATINGQTVKACLTISGSAPRTELATALGLTDAQLNTAATAAGCDNIVQNSGNAFYAQASTLGASNDAVIPISSGSWISQLNGRGVDRSSTAVAQGVTLASIDSLGQPISGTAPSLTADTTYYQSTTYGNNIYTVLPTSSITGSFADEALISLFVGSSSSLCGSTEQAYVREFGFDALTGGEGTCGSTTQTGNG